MRDKTTGKDSPKELNREKRLRKVKGRTVYEGQNESVSLKAA